MKEILFRGKKDVYDPWVFGNFIHEVIENHITHNNLDYYGIKDKDTFAYYPVKEYTIGQYTGMKDIHGNKIFEGDIVREYIGKDMPYLQWVVLYYDKIGAFILSENEIIEKTTTWFTFEEQYSQIEVIGNLVDGVFIKEDSDVSL